MTVPWEESYDRLEKEEGEYARMHKRRLNGCNDVRFDVKLWKYVYIGEKKPPIIHKSKAKVKPRFMPIFERHKEKLKDLFWSRQSFACFCSHYKINPDNYKIEDIIALRKSKLYNKFFEEEVEEM